MGWLDGFLYFAFDAAAALLLVATWQHTRIIGFLVLAASYLLGILSRWIAPVLYRSIPSDDGAGIFLTLFMRSVWFAIAAVALYGIWDIYRQLKRQPNPAPPAS